jgi:hypothetical protein
MVLYPYDRPSPCPTLALTREAGDRTVLPYRYFVRAPCFPGQRPPTAVSQSRALGRTEFPEPGAVAVFDPLLQPDWCECAPAGSASTFPVPPSRGAPGMFRLVRYSGASSLHGRPFSGNVDRVLPRPILKSFTFTSVRHHRPPARAAIVLDSLAGFGRFGPT